MPKDVERWPRAGRMAEIVAWLLAVVGGWVIFMACVLFGVDAYFKAKERFVERLIQKGMRRKDGKG